MQHSLFVVGEDLKSNPLMMDYIFERYEDYVDEKPNVYYCPKNSNNLFMLLESQIKTNDTLTIVASNDSFNLVSKVLCTLTQDATELKEETLIPSKALKFEKNSYLLHVEDKQVNVLKIDENKKLPNFLFDFEERSEIFQLINMDKDSCQILLAPLEQTYDVKILVTTIVDGWLRVKATSSKHGTLKPFIKGVKSLFPDKMMPHSYPIEYIVTQLTRHNKTITCAESCTGGLIASMLTRVAGASSILKGTLVTYANATKSSWLGVDADIIKQYGAVSEQCVRGMLQGSLTVSKASYAIAVSGIAGPDGGSKEKPVGTVYVGVANDKGDFRVERLMLDGHREFIQKQSAYHALKMVLELDSETFF